MPRAQAPLMCVFEKVFYLRLVKIYTITSIINKKIFAGNHWWDTTPPAPLGVPPLATTVHASRFKIRMKRSDLPHTTLLIQRPLIWTDNNNWHFSMTCQQSKYLCRTKKTNGFLSLRPLTHYYTMFIKNYDLKHPTVRKLRRTKCVEFIGVP